MVRMEGQGWEGDGDSWYTQMERATMALSKARQGRDLACEAEACHTLAGVSETMGESMG
jgi:hypothetical protein